MTPFWVTIWTIIASLLSGMIGVIVSSRLHRKYEKRKQKLDTLRRLVGTRWAITEGQENNAQFSREEFFVTLNEAIVVFHDSTSVIDTLDRYHESMSNDNFLRLFKAICKNLEISYELNDSFFERPFTPGPRFTGGSK